MLNLYATLSLLMVFIIQVGADDVCYETSTHVYSCPGVSWCCKDNSSCCSLTVLAWIGIVCAGLFVLVVICAGCVCNIFKIRDYLTDCKKERIGPTQTNDDTGNEVRY